MWHPTERGSNMKAINTQMLKDIEEAKIRQLRGAYWSERSKGPRPSFELVFSTSVFFVILVAIII